MPIQLPPLQLKCQQTPSENAKAPQFAMESLRPRWCIQRNGTTIVPLIAIDELPDSVLLKGVPIMLTLLEALKSHMELIPGEHPSTRCFATSLTNPSTLRVSPMRRATTLDRIAHPPQKAPRSLLRKAPQLRLSKGTRDLRPRTRLS